MASTIKLKNGSGAPTAGDLVQGEPALDLTNKRLYTEDSGGTVLEIGTNPTSITTGTFTSTGIDDNATSTAITIDSNENVGIGTSSPLGLAHIYSSSSGATAGAGGDELILESATTTGLSILSGTSNDGNILFGDSGNSAIGYIQYKHADNALVFGSNASERMRIDSSGNVRVGGASGKAWISSDANVGYFGGDSGQANHISFYDALDLCRIYTAGSERMRIDSSGNLLVGTTGVSTPLSSGGTGISLRPEGNVYLGSTVASLFLNRSGSDGEIAQFRKDGTAVGSVGTNGGDLYIGTGDTALRFLDASDFIYPVSTATGTARDNAIDLGYSTGRFDDIYATNGTIQTSDRNEKQDIAELSDAEQRVAVACKGLLRKFRWQDAVAEKGDDARIHFGIIAQDLQSAFEAEGLDAGDYAMFISSTWYEKEITVDAVEAVYEDVVVTPAQEAGFREVSPEVQAEPAYYDVDGNEIKAAVEYQAAVHEATEAVEEVTEQRLVSEAKEAYTYTDTSEEPKEGYTARTRLGVRYPELLSFIIAAI